MNIKNYKYLYEYHGWILLTSSWQIFEHMTYVDMTMIWLVSFSQYTWVYHTKIVDHRAT